jgi:multiple sugar transport system substrate-binding protein
MKKWTKALLAAASLVICGFATWAEAGAADKTTLRVATWTARSPGFQEWWQELVKTFQDDHPGVVLNVQQVAFADFTRYLTTQFVAGSPPDIVHVPLPTETLPAWAGAGFLAPLDKRLASTDIPARWPKAQAAMTWKGTTYGVLQGDYGYVMFYNDALLKTAGLAVPTTAEMLLAAATVLTKDGKYGFAITDDHSANFVRDALVFVTGMGGEFRKDGRWNWTDSKVVAGLDLWRKLGRNYSPKGTDNNAKRQAFYNGDVAMMINNPSIWPNVKTAVKPELYPSLHLGRLPFEIVSGDTSHGFAIAADLSDDRAALAWDFIQLAASAKWQTEYVRLTSSPAPRPGATDILKSDPDTKVIADAATNYTLLISNDATGVRLNYEAFNNAVVNSLHSLLQSDTPTVEVMRDLEKALVAKGITP